MLGRQESGQGQFLLDGGDAPRFTTTLEEVDTRTFRAAWAGAFLSMIILPALMSLARRPISTITERRLTTPNGVVEPIHPKAMPVILYTDW